MLIRYGYDFTVNCPQPTPMVCLVSARPEHRAQLAAPEVHRTFPDVPGRFFSDSFGNLCWRFTAPAGDLRLSGEGLIHDDGLPDPEHRDAIEHPVEDLPDEALTYLLGSRYCETDLLAPVAWNLFGHLAPGWDRVQAIVDHVNGHIRFNYHDARPTRTAHEAWVEGRGVCRDFAHLAIAFCRCLNIPARYVNGHLGDIGIPFNPDPMDYAAWMEVYLGGRWHTFDPRNNARRIGRIVVARGRDATDVPMITSFGPHWLKNFTVVTHEVDGKSPVRLPQMGGQMRFAAE
ncbi:MAG: transglutaminase family protein [Paracoccaceae bacterium]